MSNILLTKLEHNIMTKWNCVGQILRPMG